jgi:hypothetical protein
VDLGTVRKKVVGIVKESVDDIIDKGEELESSLQEAREELYSEMKKRDDIPHAQMKGAAQRSSLWIGGTLVR